MDWIVFGAILLSGGMGVIGVGLFLRERVRLEECRQAMEQIKEERSKLEVLLEREREQLEKQEKKWEQERQEWRERENKREQEWQEREAKMIREWRKREEEIEHKWEEREAKIVKEWQERETKVLNNLETGIEKISNKLLHQQGGELRRETRREVEGLLTPFYQQLEQFRKQLELLAREEREKLGAVASQLNLLEKLNKNLAEEARELTTALKGDIKTQGGWGETILKRVLELSGLMEGREFEVQPTYVVDEKKIIPDVIIQLPEERKIIIDAKTPLMSYYKYINASTESERRANLENFLKAIRKHIRNLGGKNYPSKIGEETPPMVLMFIPIEGAVATAVTADPSLIEEGLKIGVIIVSPSTLLLGLKIVETLWKRERRWQNVEEVGKLATVLYDKMVQFLKDVEKIEKGLNSATKALEGAKGKLTAPRSGVVRRLEKLKELTGINSTAQLPKTFSS